MTRVKASSRSHVIRSPVRSTWFWQLNRASLDVPLLLAIMLGIVGLGRKGIGAKLLSLTVITLSSDYVWNLPISRLHEWFDGEASAVVPLSVAYLAAWYVALRFAARWA